MYPEFLFVRESLSCPALPRPDGAGPAPGPVLEALSVSPAVILPAVVVFAVLALSGLKFVASRQSKVPPVFAVLSAGVAWATAVFAWRGAQAVIRYRPAFDSLFLAVTVLVAILSLAGCFYAGRRGARAPKGAAVAASAFFVLFGVGMLPELAESKGVAAVVLGLSAVLAVFAALFSSSYVNDGIRERDGQHPGGAKLLMFAAWFWLFYPIAGIAGLFFLDGSAAATLYSVIHLIGVALTLVSVLLLDPLPAVAEAAARKTGAGTPPPEEPDGGAPVPQPAPPDAGPSTTVVRKPEAPKPVIGRPSPPPKPQRPSGGGGGSLPAAPPRPKPKRRY